jgi:short-subunit dehydrogenase
VIGSKERYALITGASRGIGYEIAKLLAKDGKNLVAVARDKNRLEEVRTEIENKYRTKVKVLPKDLSDPKAPVAIFSKLKKENIEVDVLVNNAGFGLYGMFSQTELQQDLNMIQVHIISLMHLSKLFIKRMLENKSGWILNVAAAPNFTTVPHLSIYASSKSFVLSFSEALANEVQEAGVYVTCLCPGPTDTRIWQKGNMGSCKLAKGKKMQAADVAEAGYKALKSGKVISVPGRKHK